MASRAVYNIQFLRAAAAISVAIYHMQAMINSAYSTSYNLHFLSFGVDVFFVISGFVMFVSNSEMNRSTREFLWGRFFRIVPLYWTATLAIVMIYYAGFHPNGLNYFEPYMLLQSLLFIRTKFPDGRFDLVLSLGWTLIYELFFYAAFSLTFRMKALERSIVALALAFTLLVIIGFAVPDIPQRAAYFLKPIILEFLLGGALAIGYLRWQKHQKDVSPALAVPAAFGLIGIGIVIVLGFELAGLDIPGRENLRPFVWGPPGFLIVAGSVILEKYGFTLKDKATLLFGAASYSIYLFHPIILQGAVKVASKLLPAETGVNILVTMVVALAAAIVISIFIHLTVEERLLRVGRNFLRRRRSSEHASLSAPPVRVA